MRQPRECAGLERGWWVCASCNRIFEADSNYCDAREGGCNYFAERIDRDGYCHCEEIYVRP